MFGNAYFGQAYYGDPYFGSGAVPAPAVVVPVEAPNVYQLTGGYPPPRKGRPLEIVIPAELAALMKKSDAQIQYEKRLKKLAPLELL